MLDFTDLQRRYENFYSPRFEVEVGTTTIDESDGRLSGLEVDTAIDRANRVSFSLNHVFDHERGEFTDVDFDIFEEGTEMTVKLGYGDEIHPLFHGRIDSVQPNFPSSGAASISVSAQDLRQLMQSSKRHDSWDDASLTDVPTLIAENYPFLDSHIEGVSAGLGGLDELDHEKIVKAAESDYDYVETLAADFGFETFSRAGKFFFRRPHWDEPEALRLQWGRSLVSFRPGKPGGDRDVKTVKVYDWDVRRAEQIVGVAERDGGADGEDGLIERKIPVESPTEADARAAAIMQWTRQGPTSQGETIGLPELQIGEPIELDGLGSQFNGTYYVEEATHRIDESGYTTTFEVREILA